MESSAASPQSTEEGLFMLITTHREIKRLRLFLAGIAFLLVLQRTMAQAAPMAATPPMGWNSWNHFARKIDDATVRAQADAMASSGMRDAGYVYINIDDTWEGERDAQGFIHSNEKFPDM
jgi:alpha-galactosidase